MPWKELKIMDQREQRWLGCFEQVASCRYVDLRAGYAAAELGVGWLI